MLKHFCLHQLASLPLEATSEPPASLLPGAVRLACCMRLSQLLPHRCLWTTWPSYAAILGPLCPLQADICRKFGVSGYPTMQLGRAADLAAAKLDKLADLRPASRHFDSVIAILEKEIST